MSWMARLYETYEQGVKKELPGEPLMPISHTLQNAHINIVIDGEGNFLHAEVLEKTHIILPATESSASRGNVEAPHGLADKLQYVAKDYLKHGGIKHPNFESYRQQLFNWSNSEFTHPKVQAVYKYINNGQVIEDLIKAQIIFVDENLHFLSSWPYEVTEDKPLPLLFKVLPKTKGQTDQGCALVCWSIQIPGEQNPNSWLDESLYQSWVNFSASKEVKEGLCYISGEIRPLAVNHPAKIRHTGDKAKLISSNDTSGYTYLGRFTNRTEASGISYEVTQKAHNALSWLVARQSTRNGDQAIVAWAISCKPIPDPMEDISKLLYSDDSDKLTTEQEVVTVDHGFNLGESFALKLNKKIAGYRSELGDFEQISIMAIDSATPGRMGITYYRECLAKEFLDNIESWQLDFSWQQRHTKNIIGINGKKTKVKTTWPICAPSPYSIVEALYDGPTLSDSLKKNLYQRLLPCIVEKRSFPLDMVNTSIIRACNPMSCEHWEWERNIGVACALYRGFYKRHPVQTQRRDYSMSLEKNNKSRDYLYGRLLAMAEHIEHTALYIAQEKRSTTAERLMQRFAERPFSTWLNIELALRPYIERLKINRPGFLINQHRELDDIMSLFESEDFSKDKKLSGEFLLAYHCQRQHLQHRDAQPESI